MITVNKQIEIIDILQIAYNKIVESAFQKTSIIDKEKIFIINRNRMIGEPDTETETYILQDSGKLNKIK